MQTFPAGRAEHDNPCQLVRSGLELQRQPAAQAGRVRQASVQREGLWFANPYMKCEHSDLGQVDRSDNNRTDVPVLVAKDTSWQDKIVDLCVGSLESGSIPSPQV